MHTLQEQKDEGLRLLQSLAPVQSTLPRSPSTTSIASSSCASSMVNSPVKIEHLSHNVDDVRNPHDTIPVKTDSGSLESIAGSSVYKLKTKNLSTMVQSVAFGVHMVSPAFNFNDSDDEADHDMDKGKNVATSATVAAPSVSVSLSSQFANAFNSGISPVSVVSASPNTDSLPAFYPTPSPIPTITSATSSSSAVPSTALVPIIEDEEEGVTVVGKSKIGNLSQYGTDNEDQDGGENGITTYSSRSMEDNCIDKNISTQSSAKNTDQGPSLVPFAANRPRPLEILPVRALCKPIFAYLTFYCHALPFFFLSYPIYHTNSYPILPHSNPS